jgi:DNA-directed RNA polymerase specialized sigma subunit
MHPYMSKARFPQNWATAELVKQYMRNHRRYEVKKGRMMPRRQRSAATSGGKTTQLPNIDSDVEEDMDKENNEDENEGGENNESDAEEGD